MIKQKVAEPDSHLVEQSREMEHYKLLHLKFKILFNFDLF